MKSIQYRSPDAARTIAGELARLLGGRPPVFLCIGTDRATGDSLGPLVGSSLKRYYRRVYGTLDSPFHAANLDMGIALARSENPGLPVVAVDSCLGKYHQVGFIRVREGSLRPGAGMGKSLPLVGDFSITGTVNAGGAGVMADMIVLSNTRLSVVAGMAKVISEGILMALYGGAAAAEAAATEESCASCGAKREIYERLIGRYSVCRECYWLIMDMEARDEDMWNLFEHDPGPGGDGQ